MFAKLEIVSVIKKKKIDTFQKIYIFALLFV